MLKNANVFPDNTYRSSKIIVQNTPPGTYRHVTSFTGKASTRKDSLPKSEASAILRIALLSAERPGDHWREPRSELLVPRTSPGCAHGLTTLETLGDAPRCRRFFTMGRCPMKEATWRGVRPDWNGRERGEKRGEFPTPPRKRHPGVVKASLSPATPEWFPKRRELNERGSFPGEGLEGPEGEKVTTA